MDKAEEIKTTVRAGSSSALEDVGSDFKNTVIGCHQTNLPSALIADLIDIIPVVGDLTNAARVADAIVKGEKRVSKRTMLMQLGDLIGGVTPGLGTIIDAFTPTNTITYLSRKKMI